MLYKSIVAAYDGSETGEQALKQAIQLAKLTPDAKLTVAYSKYRPPMNFPYYGIPSMAEIEAKLQEYDDAVLEKAQELIKDLPDAAVKVYMGSPALSILECADENGADLIVIGSRGLGTFKGMMLGSVSSYVAQHAKIPVLIVKQ